MKDSKIVILDEALAYTDAENENLIQEAIKNLIKDKTVIVIAHRLKSIMEADNIIVLKEGKIIEEGTHADLINMNGHYKKLWEEYQKSVLTDKEKFVIEFSSSMSWTSITDEKHIFSVNSFGKSGKVKDILEYFNLTHDTIEKEILKMIKMNFIKKFKF